MSGKKKKRELTVKFYEEDIFHIVWYYGFLLKRIENNERIPARTLRRFFSFFESANLNDEKLREEIILNIQAQTLSYFSKKSVFKVKKIDSKEDSTSNELPQIIYKNGYADLSAVLKWRPMLHFAGVDKLPKNFEEIVSYLFKQLKQATEFENTKSKQTLVPYLYSKLKSYCNQYEEQPISDYHLIVVTGYITACFGFLMSEAEFIKQPKTLGYYTQYLHKSVSYLCKKQPKKLVPKK